MTGGAKTFEEQLKLKIMCWSQCGDINPNFLSMPLEGKHFHTSEHNIRLSLDEAKSIVQTMPFYAACCVMRVKVITDLDSQNASPKIGKISNFAWCALRLMLKHDPVAKVFAFLRYQKMPNLIFILLLKEFYPRSWRFLCFSKLASMVKYTHGKFATECNTERKTSSSERSLAWAQSGLNFERPGELEHHFKDNMC